MIKEVHTWYQVMREVNKISYAGINRTMGGFQMGLNIVDQINELLKHYVVVFLVVDRAGTVMVLNGFPRDFFCFFELRHSVTRYSLKKMFETEIEFWRSIGSNDIADMYRIAINRIINGYYANTEVEQYDENHEAD